MRLPDPSGILLALCGVPFVPGPAIAQQQLFKLTASDGAAHDQFGRSVAMSGMRGIVGASEDDDRGYASGSAYLFDVSTGQQLFKLIASDGAEFDYFGWSVAISGGRAVVGAYGDDDLGSGSGSAYVFDVLTGQELFKLTAPDGVAQDVFGWSVAISGDRAVVGAYGDGSASGSAYVFDVATGQKLFKLRASDPEKYDNFGHSVAISGSLAVVGSIKDADLAPDSGSAYLFDVSTGQQLFKLTASDGAASDNFGISVAIDGNRAVVGAHRHDNGSDWDSGAVYVFDATTGQELFKLISPYPNIEDHFGQSVGLSGDRAIIGVPLDNNGGFDRGSAYVFDVTTGQQLFRMTASDGSPGDRFGESVAQSGDLALAGAWADTPFGRYSGAAYVFSTLPAQGSAFCFGIGGGTPCPCGNSGGFGEGCENSSAAGGRASAIGSDSVADDDLVFYASNLPPPEPALLFTGENAINGGHGIQLGDGLRCVSLNIVRLGVTTSNADGQATWGPGLGAMGGWNNGDTRYFQVWYRDPGGPCNSGFNLTNGVELTFTP